jgi:hypothetical protein
LTDERATVITEEQQAAHQALCEKLERALEGATMDSALQALTAVTARLCASCRSPAAVAVTMVEDLLSSFREEMAATDWVPASEDKADR